jgi:hypothetical protein
MTRGNVYICNEFIGELGSDAYPGGDFWAKMLAMNGCKQIEFEKFVHEYIKDSWGDDKLPPESGGVGNWSYEFMWVPKSQPDDYRDWDNWTGEIYVRKYERMCGYFQFPSKWVRINRFREN